ncbi:MAG: C-GCAxxG-C-C family protein [Actinobacteria bacterium]|nr:C-GCAxxG-C-C family protein [Actinomycetota bacterium]
MSPSLDVQQIQTDAEEYFRRGNYYCSEAVVASVRDNFAPEMPDALIAAASGFPIGVGRSKCMCGAVSGGVIALGYVFGRTTPGTPADARSVKTLELANELQQAFRDSHRVLCCSVQTKGMDMASGEHKAQCIAFTGEMAAKTAEIIARELELDTATREV